MDLFEQSFDQLVKEANLSLIETEKQEVGPLAEAPKQETATLKQEMATEDYLVSSDIFGSQVVESPYAPKEELVSKKPENKAKVFDISKVDSQVGLIEDQDPKENKGKVFSFDGPKTTPKATTQTPKKSPKQPPVFDTGNADDFFDDLFGISKTETKAAQAATQTNVQGNIFDFLGQVDQAVTESIKETEEPAHEQAPVKAQPIKEETPQAPKEEAVKATLVDENVLLNAIKEQIQVQSLDYDKLSRVIAEAVTKGVKEAFKDLKISVSL